MFYCLSYGASVQSLKKFTEGNARKTLDLLHKISIRHEISAQL